MPETPGTWPVLVCCHTTQPRPSQPLAGRVGEETPSAPPRGRRRARAGGVAGSIRPSVRTRVDERCHARELADDGHPGARPRRDPFWFRPRLVSMSSTGRRSPGWGWVTSTKKRRLLAGVAGRGVGPGEVVGTHRQPRRPRPHGSGRTLGVDVVTSSVALRNTNRLPAPATFDQLICPASGRRRGRGSRRPPWAPRRTLPACARPRPTIPGRRHGGSTRPRPPAAMRPARAKQRPEHG